MAPAVIAVAVVARSDGPELIAGNLASRELHAPWIQPFADEEGFERWFTGLGETTVSLVAREVPSGRVAGVVTLSQIFRRGFQSAYLSYAGMAGFTGRGLMTEAVRAGVGYAFAELGLHRLEANIQPDNHRSVALVRRLGFRKEGFSPEYLQIDGVWRDHERWALLSREFFRPDVPQ